MIAAASSLLFCISVPDALFLPFYTTAKSVSAYTDRATVDMTTHQSCLSFLVLLAGFVALVSARHS
jgi:hypothetical protein